MCVCVCVRARVYKYIYIHLHLFLFRPIIANYVSNTHNLFNVIFGSFLVQFLTKCQPTACHMFGGFVLFANETK